MICLSKGNDNITMPGADMLRFPSQNKLPHRCGISLNNIYCLLDHKTIECRAGAALSSKANTC